MNNFEVIVLHEYGAKNHYTALSNFNIKYYEFNIFKEFLKCLLGKKNFVKFFFNIIFLITIFFKREKVIVFGIAPGDFRLFFLSLLLRNNKVYWHTSWVNQGINESLPKGFNSKSYRKIWYSCMNRLSSGVAIVNPISYSSLKVIGFKNIVSVYHCVEPKIILKDPNNVKKNMIGFIGRPEIAKGYGQFIELANKLYDKYTFYQCGTIPELDLLSLNIRNYGMLNKQDLYSKLDESKLVLNLSVSTDNWQEVFGITTLEAVLNGNYVICTSSPGSILLSKFYPKKIKVIGDNDKYDLETLIYRTFNEFQEEKENNYFNLINIRKRWKRLLRK